MDENGLYLRLSTNWSIRLPSHLWHYSYCLCKTPALCKFGSTSFHTDLLIYICLTDLCHSACLGIISKNLRSLICKGKEVKTHYITSETFSLLSVFSKSPFACSVAQPYESWRQCRSTLAISGEQITHKTCTLSRRITNLTQHARVPVALSGRIRKKLRHPSQRHPVER